MSAHQKLQQAAGCAARSQDRGCQHPGWAVPGVLGTQGSSGTTAASSPSARCAPLGTKNTRVLVSGWKRASSCFGGLILQRVISAPGRRNGPKRNRPLHIAVWLMSLTSLLLWEEQLPIKFVTSPFCSLHPTSPELLSSLDSVLAELIPSSNDSPS